MRKHDVCSRADCPQCKVYDKKPSTSDSKGVSSDDRHFVVINVTLYDDARKERVIDTFDVNTWIPDKDFKTLKKFFLTSLIYWSVVEEIEMVKDDVYNDTTGGKPYSEEIE